MFKRFSVFYTATGPFGDLGARWLGWDSAAGVALPHPHAKGIDLAALTQVPRKYGFHATLKAPFWLGPDHTQQSLQQRLLAIAKNLQAAPIGELTICSERGFIALRPAEQRAELTDLVASVVTELDPVRAPLTPAYIDRRRRSGLSERQDRQMLDWGYPYIFDDFHLHMTLTGPVDGAVAATAEREALRLFGPYLRGPHHLDALSLMGEDEGGMFHQVARVSVSG